jgi:hypothetical protein
MHANPLSAPSLAEYVPSSQALHAELELAPSTVEYVPAGQRVQ